MLITYVLSGSKKIYSAKREEKNGDVRNIRGMIENNRIQLGSGLAMERKTPFPYCLSVCKSFSSFDTWVKHLVLSGTCCLFLLPSLSTVDLTLYLPQYLFVQQYLCRAQYGQGILLGAEDIYRNEQKQQNL